MEGIPKITIGRENFDAIRRGGCYYVDKTELIYELLHDTDSVVTLFTRPRRFGKTLAMSMMESFFDITRDSRDVFDGLNISAHTEFCKEWRNQYPVLSVSLKAVEGADFTSAYGLLEVTISDLCKKLAYLAEDERVDRDDRGRFAELKSQDAAPETLRSSLKILMRMMVDVYQKPVILLIDEYDVPLAKARENGYYLEMLDVIRSMFGFAFKTNEYLKLAVVTGCLRIAKESIFTGVNNFTSYSVLDNRFSPYFGFTQGEMEELLEKADRKEYLAVIKDWYDGYIFGGSRVYCPWDVASYVSSLLNNREAKPQNYWENTSGNGVIREFVGREDFDVSPKFEVLLNGGTVTEWIADPLTYDQLYESESNLWSVLLMTGYLTKCREEEPEPGEAVELRIPNREIAGIFEKTVAKYFEDTVDKRELKALMDSLWSGDEDRASRVFSDLLWETISYHDYHEDYYHAFLTGIFVGRGYAVESNKEYGLGRPDLLLRDRRNRRAIIIETKRSRREEDMERDCQRGLRQIVDRQYAKELKGYRQILCYGVAFFQKSALVRKL